MKINNHEAITKQSMSMITKRQLLRQHVAALLIVKKQQVCKWYNFFTFRSKFKKINIKQFINIFIDTLFK